jgi:hypothetical protein
MKWKMENIRWKMENAFVAGRNVKRATPAAFLVKRVLGATPEAWQESSRGCPENIFHLPFAIFHFPLPGKANPAAGRGWMKWKMEMENGKCFCGWPERQASYTRSVPGETGVRSHAGGVAGK